MEKRFDFTKAQATEIVRQAKAGEVVFDDDYLLEAAERAAGPDDPAIVVDITTDAPAYESEENEGSSL